MKVPSPLSKCLPAEPVRPERSTAETAERAFGGSGGEALTRFSRNLADGWGPGNLEKAYSTQPPEPPKDSRDAVGTIWRSVAAFGGPAPPARAAGLVSEPAVSRKPGVFSLGAKLRTRAGAWFACPAIRTLVLSGHTGQRGRKQADPAPSRPGSSRDGPFPLRVPGLQPGVPLQAFENSGLTGGVRRRVRSLARGIRPILRLLGARVYERQTARTRVFLWPGVAA